ncbi:MAG: oxidoreductase [Bacteroidetes bacterium RBG_13_42_15]|nr:MAG: oxidoreductase [Bacteroidetes bacterium RBG_13_42_15]
MRCRSGIIALRIWAALIFLTGCQDIKKRIPESSDMIHLITVDPGHFHAALVQKTMYKGVDSAVYVYAPEGPDLELHLDRIKGFNNRQEQPTHWFLQVYAGNDFFHKMLEEKKGNVVVLAGNNRNKTEYILSSIKEGFHVLADKPMAINKEDFLLLEKAFKEAEKSNLLLYDLMTERYEITTILQRELSMMPGIFGKLVKGSSENPAVTKESVHHFFKYVSGNILIRPAWFFDVEQEGEGMVDVMTHLVDLIQWECYPEQIIDFKKDIKINDASHCTTPITLNEFRRITEKEKFPEYLLKDVVGDTVLNVFCNGQIHYQLKEVHARVSVQWAYKAPEGTGDTHYSVMRGTKANLEIRQGKEQQFKPVLYIIPVDEVPDFESTLQEHISQLAEKYPGIGLKKTNEEWEVVVPEQYHEGHEAHFARVTEKFIGYFQNKNMPTWEVPNMIAKYFTTTQALQIAGKSNDNQADSGN